MSLLNDEIREITKKKFDEEMSGPVSLLFFTQEPGLLVVPGRVPGSECLFCRETRQLLEEVASLSDKIDLQIFDFVDRRDKAAEHGVDKIPALVVAGAADAGVRFFGIPSGYEYTSLIEAILDASKGRTGLRPETKQALLGLERDVHIEVFVTPTCPYCTTAVRTAHQMAQESPRVRADMVEATEFPHLVQKHAVFGVPKTVINGALTFEGAVPEDAFLAKVLEAARLP